MKVLLLLILHTFLLVSPTFCAHLGITQLLPDSLHASRQPLSETGGSGLQKILNKLLSFKKQSQNNINGSKYSIEAATSAVPYSRPVVIWHGLGDTYDSTGMMRAAATIKKVKPHAFVYAIRISNDSSSDQQATLFGKVNEQVCFYYTYIVLHTLLFHTNITHSLYVYFSTD